MKGPVGQRMVRSQPLYPPELRARDRKALTFNNLRGRRILVASVSLFRVVITSAEAYRAYYPCSAAKEQGWRCGLEDTACYLDLIIDQRFWAGPELRLPAEGVRRRPAATCSRDGGLAQCKPPSPRGEGL